jgi:hypothetical protein
MFIKVSEKSLLRNKETWDMIWNDGNAAELDRMFNSPEVSSCTSKKICKNGRPWGHTNCYSNPEYIKKQREAYKRNHPNWKGKKNHKEQKVYLYSKENLEKMINLGKRDKIGKNNPMHGKHHSEETKNKMSEKKKFIFIGKGNPNWQGGISFFPYPEEFNDQLKEEIRKRDNFFCQRCFRKQDALLDSKNQPYKLIVHHIDFNKNNNAQRNLISLCRECHLKIHFENNRNGGGFIR